MEIQKAISDDFFAFLGHSLMMFLLAWEEVSTCREPS
jgi:hypothetical protein